MLIGGRTVARLSIRLFGPFQVMLEGHSASLESDKARALLAYLVTEAGTEHRREKLAGLLWPGGSESSARNNLRHTLSVLRKSIGDREASEPALHVTRQTVQFDASCNAWADVVSFSKLLRPVTTCEDKAIQRLGEAAELYRGEFLQAFSLPDSPEFEEWATITREQFRRQATDTLHHLVEELGGRDEVERALRHAWRLTELEPWREEAHVQVMRLLARSGRRSEALAQYHTCQRLLAEELGVEPAPETTRAYERIRAGEPAAGTSAAARSLAGAPVPPFLGDAPEDLERPPFVARECELARLDDHLRQALAGQGRVAFITGEAGSGKTALLQAFARSAQASHPDLVVAGGQSNAQTGIGDPYLPFREVLELLTGDVEAPLAAGAMTKQHALRLWRLCPLSAQALVEAGQGLICLLYTSDAADDTQFV